MADVIPVNGIRAGGYEMHHQSLFVQIHLEFFQPEHKTTSSICRHACIFKYNKIDDK